ncbi:CBS domain-containing protein [Nakamurella aerolata]|uniref:CBS domain-containing protein n=1 Tax=Nakamurella aerolata TaxID=1656892 RepID=A0A849AHA0_9ACTN|nr:CBS domain-containing protein [Nakamurella aerolata]NNG36222.1 CBS domain-containing protein [Nakamurella aerolata]
MSSPARSTAGGAGSTAAGGAGSTAAGGAGNAATGHRTVADAMIRRPKVFGPEVTVAELAGFFADDHVHLALIVDAGSGRLLSTVTRDDLPQQAGTSAGAGTGADADADADAGAGAGGGAGAGAGLDAGAGSAAAVDAGAGSAAANHDRRPAAPFGSLTGRSVHPDVPLAAAAQRLSTAGRRRLAVVDGDGLLVGLLCLKRSGRGFCSDADVLARSLDPDSGCSGS